MVWLLNVKLGAVQSTYYMVKSYRFKFPNFRIGPCGISAAYRAHFPPLIVRARVRIIPCGFRSIWCGNSAVNGAEIPHDRCISAAYRAHFPPLIVRARARIIPCAFRSRWCGNSAVNGAEIPHDRCDFRRSFCASAGTLRLRT